MNIDVIPAQAGIHRLQSLVFMGPRFHGGDDEDERGA